MNGRRFMLAMLGATLLAGCGLNRPSVDIRTYLVVPSPPPGGSAGTPLRLRVEPFAIASPYEGKPMVYRFSEARFEADFYNEYLIAPRRMLMQQSIDWLRRAGYDASSQHARDAYVLHAKVGRLYGDFREPQQPRAVLDIAYALIAPDGGKVLLEQHHTLEVPIADASAESVARGLGSALGQSLAQLHAALSSMETR